MLPFGVFYSLFWQNNIVKNKVILPYKIWTQVHSISVYFCGGHAAM